jgi:hypothetical protein
VHDGAVTKDYPVTHGGQYGRIGKYIKPVGTDYDRPAPLHPHDPCRQIGITGVLGVERGDAIVPP